MTIKPPSRSEPASPVHRDPGLEKDAISLVAVGAITPPSSNREINRNQRILFQAITSELPAPLRPSFTHIKSPNKKSEAIAKWMKEHEELFSGITSLNLSKKGLTHIPLEITHLKVLNRLILDEPLAKEAKNLFPLSTLKAGVEAATAVVRIPRW